MVVTKPLGETTDVLHKPKEGETPPAGNPGLAAPFVPLSHPGLHHGLAGSPGMSRRQPPQRGRPGAFPSGILDFFLNTHF